MYYNIVAIYYKSYHNCGDFANNESTDKASGGGDVRKTASHMNSTEKYKCRIMLFRQR